jgi:NAD-dependent DNA ligase
MKKYSGPFVLSCKLDGVSGMYSTEGKTPKLYTRGDGNIGQDISHLIPFLKLPKEKGIVVRGEFIIPKETFDEKYKVLFANPRNLVSGIVNSKSADKKMEDLHFVAYELIRPQMIPSEQMKHLTNAKFEVVQHITTETLTNDMLSQVLVDWRKNYAYEIDGVIVANDGIYERHSGNPEHAFAFKMVLSDQVAEAKVVDVIWTPSKDGYLKPRVQIEPINLGGVCIEYATGFNAGFINENNIGVGSLIEIIRSGDVIPYIRKVVVPAKYPKMPNVLYKWNDTNVDIMLQDIDSDETVREKNITGFFRGIGVEGLSSGNITRIIKKGYDTIEKIVKMSVDNFLEVDGFQIKTAT